MTREEVKKIVHEKKVKKALKCLRFRKLKNFLFWFMGVILMPVVLIFTMFIGLKVVPISTYTGGAEKEYVSEELSNQSILDVILNLNKYGVSDIPGVRDMVLDAINGSGVDEFITINEEKLNDVRFSYDKESGKEILTEVLNCISLNPNAIGEDVGSISMLNEYEEVPTAEIPETKTEGGNVYLADEKVNPKVYYYEVEQSSGGNEGFSDGGDQPVVPKKYARAFDNDGKRIAPIGATLYYPALKDVPIMDLTGMIDEMVARIDVGEVVSIVFDKMEKDENDELTGLYGAIVGALTDKSLNDIDTIASDLLSAVCLKDVLGEKANELLGAFGELSLLNWTEIDVEVEFKDKIDSDGNIKILGESPTDKPIFELNPLAYYYKVGDAYERVFDDEGKRVAPADQTIIYYANLLETPVSTVMDLSGELVGRVNFGEVLSVLLQGELEKEDGNELIKTLVDALLGKSINDLDNIANDLLSSFTLTKILGGEAKAKEVLADFATLGVFTWNEKVAENEFDGKLNGNDIAKEEKEDGKLLLNPALYYYSNNGKYERAFDNDGKRVAPVGEKLYYANLLDVALSDMLGLAPSLLEKIDLGEVLSIAFKDALAKEKDGLLKTLVDALLGKSINDLDNIANDLLSSFTLTKILGGEAKAKEVLADFATLGVFTWNEKVAENEFDGKLNGNDIAKEEKEDGKLLLNPALYYYSNNGKYERAFDNDGKRVAPVGEELYYANLLDIPVSELLKVAGDVFGQLELKQLLGALKINGGLFDALFKDGDTIKDFSSNDFVNKLFNRLSLSSLKVDFGVIDDLDAFKTWESVKESDKPLPEGQTAIDTSKHNAKLYYYLPAGADATLDTSYVRAFNDDGTAVDGVNYQTQLFYAKLSYVGFLDMAELLPVRIGSLPAVDLINAFGGASIDSDDLIGKVLGDKTVSQLGDLGDIYLHWVMPYSADNEICKVILQSFYDLNDDASVNEANYNTITTAMLSGSGLKLDNIGLDSFIDQSTRELIANAVTAYRKSDEYTGENKNVVVSSSNITVGDIKEFNPDYILLSSVAGGMTAEMKTLIGELVGTSFDSVMVKDLSKAKPDNISLGRFITDSDTLNMICDAITAYRKSAEYVGENKNVAVSSSNITVGDIKEFNPDYILLSSVAGGMTAEMKTLIGELVGTSFDSVMVKDLSKADPDKITLKTVLGEYDEDGSNAKIYKILLEASNQTISKENADKLKVDALSNFQITNLTLGTAMPDANEDLKKIIEQITNSAEGSFDSITIEKLSGGITVDNITLSTVLGEYDEDGSNATIYKILLEASNQMVSKENADKLKVSVLSNFQIKYVTLGTAMPGANDTLKTLIEQITNSEKGSFDSITIEELSGGITVDKITLSTVLGEYGADGKNNKTLYNILLEASSKEINANNANELKMSALTNFDLSNVSLSTALSDSAKENVILSALMGKGVKLGDIGTAIDSLTLYEIFGKTCFTTVEAERVPNSACMFEFIEDYPVVGKDGAPVLGENGEQLKCDAYVHITETREQELRDAGIPVYYLHKNDGIWLLMCFEFGDIDDDESSPDYGRPDEYYVSDNTLGSLMKTNEGESNFMSKALTEATLRQLMDAGMVNFESRELYAKTLTDIIKILDNLAKNGGLTNLNN